MKIFLVNDKFFYEGGTEVYLRQLATSLKKAGHTPILIYGSGPTSQKLKDDGFTGYQIPGLEEEFPKNRGQVLSKINETVKKEKPDIIQLNNIQNGYMVEEFMNLAPTIRHVHDHRLYCPGFSKTWYRSNEVCPIPFSYRCLINAYKEHCATNKPTKLLKKYQAKFHELDVNRRLHRILLASDFMSSQLIINEFDPKKFMVLPHFVKLPAKVTPASGNREILFVGRVTVEKGVQYVIEAMKQINGTLKIVGTGPQEDEYRQLAVDLNVNHKVEFVGKVPDGEIGKYYKNSDLIVFPSIWPEPHGKIGPEAFSYGRPVVGFDTGGVSEWLKDGFNGFLVPRLDVLTLAKKINKLLDDNHLANKMGANGRVFVEKNMSEQVYLEKLLKLYQETNFAWQKEMVFA